MRIAMPVCPGSLASSTFTPGDETVAVQSVRVSKSSRMTAAASSLRTSPNRQTIVSQPRPILHPPAHIRRTSSTDGLAGSRVAAFLFGLARRALGHGGVCAVLPFSLHGCAVLPFSLHGRALGPRTLFGAFRLGRHLRILGFLRAGDDRRRDRLGDAPVAEGVEVAAGVGI